MARLYAASATGRAQRVVAALRRDGIYYDATEIWDGDWLTGLVGSGNLLAVSKWTTTPNADLTDVTVSDQRLSSIDSRRPVLHVIAKGTETTVSASAAQSRVAVLRPNDTVGIYSAKGALLKQITPSSANEVAYGGAWSSSRTVGRSRSMTHRAGRSYTRGGVRTKTPNLQPGNLRAYGRIALYFADVRHLSQSMHLVDLGTGRELVLPPSSHPWGAAGAAVGPLGVAYSVNTYRFGAHPKQSGTLVFRSTAKVLEMIRRG